jgi:hypothetical protein
LGAIGDPDLLGASEGIQTGDGEVITIRGPGDRETSVVSSKIPYRDNLSAFGKCVENYESRYESR